jgi:hypothetical protein
MNIGRQVVDVLWVGVALYFLLCWKAFLETFGDVVATFTEIISRKTAMTPSRPAMYSMSLSTELARSILPVSEG